MLKFYPCAGRHRHSLLQDLFGQPTFSQLEAQHHNELTRQLLERQRTRVHIQTTETNDSYQIQFHKAAGDFSSYEIRLVRNKHHYLLKVVSEEENFSKSYELDKHIDIDRIDYHWYRQQNVLVVDLPKKSRDMRKQEKAAKRLRRLQKKKMRALRRSRKHQQKTELSDSEVTPSESETSSSDSEQAQTKIASKLSHKPVMEEVEDEEFILLRKRLEAN